MCICGHISKRRRTALVRACGYRVCMPRRRHYIQIRYAQECTCICKTCMNTRTITYSQHRRDSVKLLEILGGYIDNCIMPLRRMYAWGVPTNEALDAIRQYSPPGLAGFLRLRPTEILMINILRIL